MAELLFNFLTSFGRDQDDVSFSQFYTKLVLPLTSDNEQKRIEVAFRMLD